jgi:hypothetical protein
MTNPRESVTRARATKAELQRRLTIIAVALLRGMGGAQTIQAAMEMLRISRRTAQRYVREMQAAPTPRAKQASALAREYQKRRVEEAGRSCADL